MSDTPTSEQARHQRRTFTLYDRYPVLFAACRDLRPEAKSILSFGCADGSETRTLSDLYFPEAAIHGVDIEEDLIRRVALANKSARIRYSLPCAMGAEYDIVFCLAVFCVWPETYGLEDCSDFYTFDKFEAAVTDVASRVAPGGMLVIFNSNFLFLDCQVSSAFDVALEGKKLGFDEVHKYDTNNKRIAHAPGPCIFVKR